MFYQWIPVAWNLNMSQPLSFFAQNLAALENGRLMLSGHVHCFRWFFPTCQVRVVRFYQSCRLLLPPPPPPPPPSPRLLLPPDLNYSHPRQVLAAGPQPRPSQPSVGCRTPTTASPAQCWLPDLNHGHPGAVLAAGPQPPCQI